MGWIEVEWSGILMIKYLALVKGKDGNGNRVDWIAVRF